jgi:hypothetical protein
MLRQFCSRALLALHRLKVWRQTSRLSLLHQWHLQFPIRRRRQHQMRRQSGPRAHHQRQRRLRTRHLSFLRRARPRFCSRALPAPHRLKVWRRTCRLSLLHQWHPVRRPRQRRMHQMRRQLARQAHHQRQQRRPRTRHLSFLRRVRPRFCSRALPAPHRLKVWRRTVRLSFLHQWHPVRRPRQRRMHQMRRQLARQAHHQRQQRRPRTRHLSLLRRVLPQFCSRTLQAPRLLKVWRRTVRLSFLHQWHLRF